MFVFRLRFLSATVALGVAGAFAATLPAPAANQPPPAPSNEGPAGPPALMPNGRVAPAPQVTSPQISAGCPIPVYGPHYYAPGVPGGGKTVALTFDDGPGRSTKRILTILANHKTPATFFNLGQNQAAQPSLVRREARWGHMLGNHTWSHPDMATRSRASQAWQMDTTTVEQRSLVGFPPCAFRPPYGSYNSTTLSLAQQRLMKVWLWSVDTEDWKAGGSSSTYWVDRIIRRAERQGGAQQHPVVLMHNQPSGNPATAIALPTIIRFFRNHGYRFVDLLGRTGLGYLILTSNGGVHAFGAPWYGSMANKLPAGVTPVGLAANPPTAGYWILRSDGGVNNFHAPWHGSLAGKLPAGVTVTAIAASPTGGYLILTSNGGVHSYGTPWYGSMANKLPAGVTPVGLAAAPASGGYWILRSDGAVDHFHAPSQGSMAGKLPAGVTVAGISGE